MKYLSYDGLQYLWNKLKLILSDYLNFTNLTVKSTALAAGKTPTVKKSGTASNPIVTFGIPKGDKGVSITNVNIDSSNGHLIVTLDE